MAPKVSVIVPVYNVDDCLARCLDSLCAQTLRDIEILCIDDGSTDSSPEILRRYAAQDARIRIITQTNQGLSCARNRGVDLAQGEFIYYVDSDDWVDVDSCEKLYDAAARHGADIAVGGVIKVYPRYRLRSPKYLLRYQSEDIYASPTTRFTAINYHHIVMQRLYRRSALLQLGITFREKVCFEDVEYTMRVMGEMGWLVTVPDTYYHYIVRRGSISKGKMTLKKQQALYQAHKSYVAYMDKIGVPIPAKARTYTKRCWTFGPLVLFRIQECDGWEIWRLFDCIKIRKRRMED